MEKLEFIFEGNHQSTIDLWQSIYSELKRYGQPVELYGELLSVDDVGESLQRSNKKSFNIKFQDYLVRAANIPNYNITLFQIEKKKRENCWFTLWVDKLINKSGFVHAWLVNSEYNYWQNVKDPLQYELKNKSYAKLKLIDNKLPPPLSKKEIDVSENPGLRLIDKGYVEAVGGEMWLGKTFFENLNLEMDKILACGFAETLMVNPNIIYIKAWDKPFDSDKGEQRELQLALRNLLFSNSKC